MPDDENIEETIAEQDNEAMAAFNEAIGDDSDTSDATVDDKAPKKDDESDKSDKTDETVDDKKSDKSTDDDSKEPSKDDQTKDKDGSDKDGDKKVDEKVDDDIDEDTAEGRLRKRAKELGYTDDEEDPSAQKKPEDQPSGDQLPPGQPSSESQPSDQDQALRLTKENVGKILGLVSDDELPEGEIVIGDETVNLTDFRKAAPDEFNAMKLISGVMVKNVMDKLFASGLIVTTDQLEDLKQGYEKQLSDRIEGVSWWQEVLFEHPDARKIKDSKKFKEWYSKLPPSYKKLGNGDAKDAIDVITLYKEHTAETKAVDHDEKLTDKKKKHDDLHKGEMKKDKKLSSPGLDINDAEAAFMEEAKKDD